MRTGKKEILNLLAAVFTLFTVPACFADGVAFRGKDYLSMSPITQQSQRALISHHNGVQKMLITVSLPLDQNDNAVWIFPVPGKPENVKIDVSDSFPRLKGTNPKRVVSNYFRNIFHFQLFMPLFPLNGLFMPLKRGGAESAKSGVSTFEQIDKYGIHIETLKADSIDVLSDYLKEKKTSIDLEHLKPFEDYLSDNYVLVASWISSTQELVNKFPEYKAGQGETRWPCVYVEFPTENPFYPMRPTSAYGNSDIEFRLVIIGYFGFMEIRRPELFRIGYYHQENVPENMNEKFLSDFKLNKGRYTSIYFYGYASWFDFDLQFQQINSISLRFAEKIEQIINNDFAAVIIAICYLLVPSYLSAGFAGLLLYRKWQRFSLLGLAGIFGIIGILIASYFARNIFKENFNRWGRATFLFVYVFIYAVLSIGLVMIIGFSFFSRY